MGKYQGILIDNPLADVRRAVSVEDLRGRAKTFDLIALATPPTPKARLAWARCREDLFLLDLFSGRENGCGQDRLEIRRGYLGTWFFCFYPASSNR